MSNSENRLDYGQLMQKAMRQMMADILRQVAEDGLPGEHHFYISFETDHPGVDIPDWLRDTYPEEMTIVLQDWFDDLAVAADRFSVTLNFSDMPQALVIPFEAVRTFVDPSVRFGLKFDPQEAGDLGLEGLMPGEEEEEEGESATPEDASTETTEGEDEDQEKKPSTGADIVTLDHFRKQ